MSVSKNKSNLLPSNGEMFLYKDFLALNSVEILYEELFDKVSWKHESIMMFGKRVMQPRLTALYGEPEKPFRYSGITMNPIEWNEPLLKIKEKVEKVTKTTFSSALLNLYRDGNDSMGWHRDNEKELGINPLIASVSLGEARPFLVRDYREKKTKIEIELTSGSLLLMAGESQNFWEHCVPKRKRITNSRINITFRNILS